jgi:hypothetical protein
LVALVTLNVRVAPAVADPEFIPEFAPAEALPGADALAFAPPGLAVPPAAPASGEFMPVPALVLVPSLALAAPALADPPSCPVS